MQIDRIVRVRGPECKLRLEILLCPPSFGAAFLANLLADRLSNDRRDRAVAHLHIRVVETRHIR